MIAISEIPEFLKEYILSLDYEDASNLHYWLNTEENSVEFIIDFIHQSHPTVK